MTAMTTTKITTAATTTTTVMMTNDCSNYDYNYHNDDGHGGDYEPKVCFAR